MRFRTKQQNPRKMLRLGTREFFASKSLSELARIQGVKPLKDPHTLIGRWPADENIDEFLEEMYEQRKGSVLRCPYSVAESAPLHSVSGQIKSFSQ